jgi:XRE family aerobic/anaerobic benzoate catabolism transcriptional regulator
VTRSNDTVENDDEAELLARLARRVRRGRQDQGITRKALGDRTGISERFLADIEAGRANPSLLRLARLATALRMSLADLVADGRTGHPPGEGPLRVALLGLRGAGKSTVGRALAAAIGARFVELDERVEERVGLDLGQIFTLHGDDYYRRSERAALRSILEEPGDTVLATGGGLVTEHETYALLRSEFRTVWLRARPEDHWQRVVEQGDTRPMTGHERAFNELCVILRERERLYELAEWTIDTSGRDVPEIVASLTEKLIPAV